VLNTPILFLQGCKTEELCDNLYLKFKKTQTKKNERYILSYTIEDFKWKMIGKDVSIVIKMGVKVIREIPKEKYKNIIKGTYERPEKYVSKKNKTRKIKKNYL
jgi:hypothetical protein